MPIIAADYHAPPVPRITPVSLRRQFFSPRPAQHRYSILMSYEISPIYGQDRNNAPLYHVIVKTSAFMIRVFVSY